jgi:hypothetical protein
MAIAISASAFRDEGDPSSVMNIKAFGMLYQLFQMMVQPIAAQVPGIAIAK